MTTATKTEKEAARQAREEIKAREEQESKGTLGYLWANYSLSIVLAIVTVVVFVLHAIFGWVQYSADQLSHGATPQVWGPDGYWVYFGEWTLQNWQAEFLQLLLMVLFTAWFVHRGSAESRDSQDEMQATLHRLELQLNRLEKRLK